MEERKKKETEFYGIREEDDTMACSAQECTGLIPALPENEDAIERYQELFPYLARARKEKEEDSGEGCERQRNQN